MKIPEQNEDYAVSLSTAETTRIIWFLFLPTLKLCHSLSTLTILCLSVLFLVLYQRPGHKLLSNVFEIIFTKLYYYYYYLLLLGTSFMNNLGKA